MLLFDGAVGLFFLGVWIFCIIDVITTPEDQCRNLPKIAWLFIVILLIDIGSVAWLVAGRAWNGEARRPLAGTPARPGQRPKATNPDDDEDTRLRKALLVLIAANASKDQFLARLGEEQAHAASKSGADAVATVGAAGKREQQSDHMSEDHEKRIRNTPGADAPVDPAVRDVGLGSLCRRAAYRDSEQCRLRRPAPR